MNIIPYEKDVSEIKILRCGFPCNFQGMSAQVASEPKTERRQDALSAGAEMEFMRKTRKPQGDNQLKIISQTVTMLCLPILLPKTNICKTLCLCCSSINLGV